MTTCVSDSIDDTTYHTQYDATEGGDISMTIVDAMATITGTPAHELEPLYGAIEPDALEAITRSADRVVVEFNYCGHDIVVDSDGNVLVLDN